MSPKSILILFFSAFLGLCCESKPIHPHPPSAEQKVLPKQRTSTQIELESEVLEGNRDALEPSIILNGRIQACLRQAILRSGPTTFSVEFAGQVSPNGVVSEVEVEHSDYALAQCLKHELTALRLVEGPFKMRLSRLGKTPPKSKTFLLDLGRVKKFQ